MNILIIASYSYSIPVSAAAWQAAVAAEQRPGQVLEVAGIQGLTGE